MVEQPRGLQDGQASDDAPPGEHLQGPQVEAGGGEESSEESVDLEALQLGQELAPDDGSKQVDWQQLQADIEVRA